MNICYFWDIQNCAVPRNFSPYEVAVKLRDLASNSSEHIELGFYCYCDLKQTDLATRQEFARARVTIKDVPSSKPGAADMKMLQDIQRHTLTNKSGVIVLITGDVDFAETIFDLVNSGGYKVILIHNQQARKELTKNASISIDFYTALKVNCRCMQCNKTFKSEEALSQHLKSHTKETKAKESAVKCNQCSKSFKNEMALSQHAKSHTKEAKAVETKAIKKTTIVLKCNRCSETFKSEVDLAQHVKSHSVETKANYAERRTRNSLLGSERSFKIQSGVFKNQMAFRLPTNSVKSSQAAFQQCVIYYAEIEPLMKNHFPVIILTANDAVGVRVAREDPAAWLNYELKDETRLSIGADQVYYCTLSMGSGQYYISVFGNNIYKVSKFSLSLEFISYELDVVKFNSYWKKFDGTFQSEACKTGASANGDALYTIRADYCGGCHLGYISQDSTTAIISYGGKEVFIRENFEVLSKIPGSTWVTVLSGKPPPHAIVGGKEADGRPIFVSRANVRQQSMLSFWTSSSDSTCAVLPGKVINDCCLVAHAGKEISINEYEVLVLVE